MFSKKSTIFLTALFSCALGCMLAGALFLSVPKSAHAETQSLSDESTATLFLPSSYEQYLVLNEPSDIALSDSYLAVADGNVLYIYDRATGLYTKKEITEDRGTITKIGFAGNRLFIAVSASSNTFYEYNFSSKDLEKLEINCSTFYICDDVLYTASLGVSNTTISSYSIADLTTTHTATTLGTLSKNTTPSITLLNGTLYCTVNDRVYYHDLEKNDQLSDSNCFYLSLNATDNQDVQSTCAHNGAFYYTADGGLYRANFSSAHKAEEAVLVFAGKDLGALTSYNGALYCLRGKSVVELKVNEDGSVSPTDYEISSSSDSINRLNGAKDSARAGNFLVTADTDNNRISVYDMEKNSFEIISAEYAPSLIATDGSVIAAASENSVYAYSRDVYGSWKEITRETLSSGDKVSGIACVFGKVYYVSSAHRGVLGGESVINTTSNGLAANLYGDLFVASNDGKVRHFTEESFLQEGSSGEEMDINLPTNATSLRADFQGNLYYLNGGKMYCNGDATPFATIDGKDFVYTGETDKKPVSFALGFEDDEVYFLFGDFIVKSNAGALGFTTSEQFSDAKDIVRAGDLLVTAHMDNRISVYDRKKHSFSFIQTDFSPTLVATDGSVIAAASGNKVYVCNYGDNCFGDPTIADLGTIKGLACVHGNVYYITQYGYGKVEEDDFGLVSRLEGSLEALAADANGILYVVDVSGRVRYFYEEEFIDPEVISGGDAGITLQMPLSSLRADRQGNLYYIHNNEIWKNDSPFFKIDDTLFAYGDERELTSFALGFEDDQVFLLYGSRIIKTSPGALDIPHMDQSNALSNHFDILTTDIRRKRS